RRTCPSCAGSPRASSAILAASSCSSRCSARRSTGSLPSAQSIPARSPSRRRTGAPSAPVDAGAPGIYLSAKILTQDQEDPMADQQTTTQAVRSTWQIDPAHTLTEFSVRHMMITTVRGRIANVSGTIELDEADVTRSVVDVTIDAASIDTRQEQRDAHLRSADFLDVENHPTITFRSTKIERRGEKQYTVTGDLTIRGVTKPVVLDVVEQG